MRPKGHGVTEHAVQGRDAGHVPAADGLVEGHDVAEHAEHARDAGHVPGAK